jgi:hypothetical protein
MESELKSKTRKEKTLNCMKSYDRADSALNKLQINISVRSYHLQTEAFKFAHLVMLASAIMEVRRSYNYVTSILF